MPKFKPSSPHQKASAFGTRQARAHNVKFLTTHTAKPDLDFTGFYEQGKAIVHEEDVADEPQRGFFADMRCRFRFSW